MKFQAKETKAIIKKLKPAARPRYNAGNLNSALEAAARVSLHRNDKIQVVPTAYGWTMVAATEIPTTSNGYFETDGATITMYEKV